MKKIISILILSMLNIFLLSSVIYAGNNTKTENQMIKAATEAFYDKYNMFFEIEKDGLLFDSKKGSEDRLSGYAHPEDAVDEQCYFRFSDDTLEDSYSFLIYKNPINERIQKELDNNSLIGDINIKFSAIQDIYDQNKSIDDILHGDDCLVCFDVYEYTDKNVNEYVSLIKTWMDFLYKLDYRWYFEIHDKKHPDDIFFTLSPTDKGYTKTSDWSDKELEESVNDGLKSIYYKKLQNRKISFRKKK